MGYVEDNLMPDEAVIYRAKLHWIIYAFAAFWLGLAALLLLSSAFVDRAFLMFALPFGFIGACLFLVRWVRAKTSEFAVTDRRVLIKVGVLRRRSLEVLIDKVEGIGVDQSLFGRMLGYGTIKVTGTGGTKEPFRLIENPQEFRRQVLNCAQTGKVGR
jgi:uncharacterized membrane protein YdbT with pleckstrin-like domain